MSRGETRCESGHAQRSVARRRFGCKLARSLNDSVGIRCLRAPASPQARFRYCSFILFYATELCNTEHGKHFRSSLGPTIPTPMAREACCFRMVCVPDIICTVHRARARLLRNGDHPISTMGICDLLILPVSASSLYTGRAGGGMTAVSHLCMLHQPISRLKRATCAFRLWTTTGGEIRPPLVVDTGCSL